MKLINMHILPADREMIARVTGYPFQSALDVLQRSSKGYFARFLSSKKYVVHDGNKYGLHLVRALLAERVLEARRSSLPTIDHQHPDIASFRDHGIVVVKTRGLKQQITDPKERADLLRLFQYAAGMTALWTIALSYTESQSFIKDRHAARYAHGQFCCHNQGVRLR